MNAPKFGDWGWQIIGENLEPIWLAIPPLSKSSSELMKYGCKTSRRGRCKCKKSGFVCTELCACNGNCYTFVWLAKKFISIFKSFLGQYLATNMLFSLFLVSCCIVLLRIMFK